MCTSIHSEKGDKNEYKVIVLPDAEEIVKRLAKVYDDELAQRLYAKVAQRAGEEKVAEGVVMIFTLSIYDVCQGYPPMIQSLMFNFVPMWIDALLDDKEVAEAAKAFLKKTTDEARQKNK